MRKRVSLAQTLVLDPDIILMDEPFSALDVQTRQLMENEVLALWAEKKKAVLFITHDLDEAIFLSDRILVLSAHPGEVQELIEVPVPHPRSTAQLISPEFLATKTRLEELIHRGAVEDEEDLGTYQMVARLTDVSDSVD